jgi:single-stranded-DNA-specific exonuclease
LRSCSELLTAFGGHKMAAGLEIEESKMDAFRSRFNAVCEEKRGDER